MPHTAPPFRPTLRALAAVALGGALGTLLRALILAGALYWNPAAGPFATLVENLLGAGLLGLLSGLFVTWGKGSQHLRLFLTTGLLGSFTTFSALALDTLALTPAGALGYLAATLPGGLILALAGLHAGRRLGRRHSG